MAEAADQRRAIDEVNAHHGASVSPPARHRGEHRRRRSAGLDADEAAQFDLVLAAPHSRLRRSEDQTERLLAAVAQPAVRILAHPRGRIAGSRAGIVADWGRVFAAAADRGVAVEIDGDPARQDLDYVLARQALDAGLSLRPRQRRAYHRTARLRRHRTGPRAAGRGPERPHRQLLAAGSAPRLDRDAGRRTAVPATLHFDVMQMLPRLKTGRRDRASSSRRSAVPPAHDPGCLADWARLVLAGP